jgi:hypothetical protein
VADNGGRTLEAILANIGVGVIAAAFGVWAGVQVHSSQIEDIKHRLDRIESKVDRLIERKIET